MSLLARLLDWTVTLPKWQGDLFRRSLECSGSLTNSPEWDEIRSMVRKEVGVPLVGSSPPEPILAVSASFSGVSIGGQKLVLKSVTCTANISAVPDGSMLPIGHEGLTAVYGENGSGKSSYSRVLKKACRARQLEDVRPNLYRPKDTRPATADIRISVEGGQDEDITWTEGKSVATPLSSIAVYDSKCGRVILDKESELQYSFYGTFAFTHVAETMKTISVELSREKPQPLKPVLTFKGRTEASVQYDSLGESSKREILEHLNFGIEARYNLTLNLVTEAKEEQRIHATSKLGEEPLAHAGSPIWKNLYLAAREYSTLQAYPTLPFPNSEEKARCELCMQDLGQEAKERFARFEDFMDDRLSKKVRLAEEALSDLSARLQFNGAWTIAHFDTVIAPLAIDDLPLHLSISTLFAALLGQIVEVKNACESNLQIPVWTSLILPEVEFTAWSTARQSYIENLDQSFDSALKSPSKSWISSATTP